MKNRLTFIVIVLAAFVAAVVGTVVVPSSSDASDLSFTDRTIKGSWGFSASGTLLPPALPSATPAAAVGVMEFDGNGGCTLTEQVNIGGSIIPPAGFRTSTSCSYNVNSDGTGTLTAIFAGDPAPTPLAFVIVDNGREVQFIRTDAGVAEGVAKRQR